MADSFVTVGNDNTAEWLEKFAGALGACLEELGQQAEGYAQDLCPVGEINGGTLRNSITHIVNEDDKTVIIGTNVEYAPYVEFGTGVFAETGGRQTPWSYQDAAGEWHRTNGQRPQPYLRPSINDHEAEYKEITSKYLTSE